MKSNIVKILLPNQFKNIILTRSISNADYELQIELLSTYQDLWL